MNSGLRLLQHADLANDRSFDIRPLWYEYFATGLVTLLTSRWNTGKTTLLSLLLESMASGKPVGGAPFTAKRAVIISEEPAKLWHERSKALGLCENVKWICQPFDRRPRPADWMALIELAGSERPDFVAIDTLAYFLPDDRENSSVRLLAALEPLHWLTRGGASVVLSHHPRKARSLNDFSPRGSGALTAFADILLQLDLPRHSLPIDRRRVIRCSSRLQGSSLRTFELSPDGRDYALLPDPPDPACYDAGWSVLQTVFEDSAGRLTRKEILNLWPEDHDAPSKSTLHNWLVEAVRRGRLLRQGRARMNDPFQYELARNDPPPSHDGVPDLEPVPPLAPMPDLRQPPSVVKPPAATDPEKWKCQFYAP